MHRSTLLVVEDDPHIQRVLDVALTTQGFRVILATEGLKALELAAHYKPDHVIVDLGLPDVGGLFVIQRLREWYTGPILVLSARSREADKVSALDAGAEDYLTKPFGMAELLARLRIMERHRVERYAPEVALDIRIGVVELNLLSRRVWKNGEDLHLTPVEYDLLTTLVRNRGKVVTHRQLLLAVWGPAHTESSQYLRVYMRSLRRKIEVDAARPCLILTEIGVGYRLTDERPSSVN